MSASKPFIPTSTVHYGFDPKAKLTLVPLAPDVPELTNVLIKGLPVFHLDEDQLRAMRNACDQRLAQIAESRKR